MTGEMCVVAPGGWQGPVVLRADAEQCPGTAPSLSFRAFGGLQVPATTCGCSCQSVPLASQSCGAVEVGLGSAPCSHAPELVRAVVPQGQCVQINDNMVPGGQFQFVDIGPSQWSASTGCTPQPAANVPAYSWTDEYIACELPTACAADGTCVPALQGSDQLCVYVDGAVECPTAFPNRIDAWQGAMDTRACSACTCGAPSGTCTGEIAFRESDCAVFRAELARASIDFCHGVIPELSGVPSMGAVSSFAPSGGSCAAGSSSPQGAVTETGQRTVCCQ